MLFKKKKEKKNVKELIECRIKVTSYHEASRRLHRKYPTFFTADDSVVLFDVQLGISYDERVLNRKVRRTCSLGAKKEVTPEQRMNGFCYLVVQKTTPSNTEETFYFLGDDETAEAYIRMIKSSLSRKETFFV